MLQGKGNTMQRNGKTQHRTGDTLTLVGTPSELVGMSSKLVGMVSELRGTPSRRRAAAFTANASIARRHAAAQLAIDAVLEDHDLQKQRRDEGSLDPIGDPHLTEDGRRRTNKDATTSIATAYNACVTIWADQSPVSAHAR
jgi:hypothetical protein